MPKRKRLNIVKVQSNNQTAASLPSSPSINNEVEPSQQPAPSQNNASESSHQHAMLEETNSRVAPSPPPRKPRGPTLMSHIWELEKGVKVNVIFDPTCHPVGKEGYTLTRFLDTVARKSDVAPINYKEWRDMPQIYKDDMWKIIESKFLIEESRTEQIESWIMTYVNEKWKSYKNELKSTGFDPLLTVDEMYDKINDSQVDKEQFEVLVEYWRSEKGEEGGLVSEKASQVMEQLKNYMSESTSSTNALEETTSWRDDVFSKVKGSDKKGRVCCLGKLMKARFPDENITDILQAANQLGAANRLDREVPDANSGQGFSPNNRSSSQSSHHLLSRQNESNEENDGQRD
ncbi:hypothetical protein SLEP1_g21091 [Rubroshorea leprosula]|uniref:Uncharacterized protein n=1 Tax=Rubroshorea leprosula TaxID=152421 RepID=A0AAV5J4Q8_9ROSI|nr:hypothetical protein SLEP1_g21091 [Rubroshorea leprosula]